MPPRAFTYLAVAAAVYLAALVLYAFLGVM